MNVKRFYLTYPKNDATRDSVIAKAKEFFGPKYEWSVVCEELHEDGTPHLHCIVVLKTQYDVVGADKLDVLAGKHGNYQSVKNMRKCLKYVTKDGIYTKDGINDEQIKLILQRKKPISRAVSKRLAKGEDPTAVQEIDGEYRTFYMMNKKKVDDYFAFIRILNLRKDKLKWPPLFEDGKVSNSGAELRIAKWLMANIKKPRHFRQHQLYIWGPTSIGKSTLIESLKKWLSVYVMPAGEDWYDGYFDNMYDLVVLDEFYGNKRVTFLNEFLQGSHMSLKKKGSQYLKTDNPPMIIVSNLRLEDCYKTVPVEIIIALKNRLEEIQVYEPLTLKLKANSFPIKRSADPKHKIRKEHKAYFDQDPQELL